MSLRSLIFNPFRMTILIPTKACGIGMTLNACPPVFLSSCHPTPLAILPSKEYLFTSNFAFTIILTVKGKR